MHGDLSAFRMRIWRGKTSPAIVLVSQLPGGPSPSWGSCRLANLAHHVYLGFTRERTLNFEDELMRGQRRLFLVEFTPHGYGLRQYLTRAVRRSFRWSSFEELVGSAIEH
jgi:hypothetical protein